MLRKIPEKSRDLGNRDSIFQILSRRFRRGTRSRKRGLYFSNIVTKGPKGHVISEKGALFFHTPGPALVPPRLAMPGIRAPSSSWTWQDGETQDSAGYGECGRGVCDDCARSTEPDPEAAGDQCQVHFQERVMGDEIRGRSRGLEAAGIASQRGHHGRVWAVDGDSLLLQLGRAAQVRGVDPGEPHPPAHPAQEHEGVHAGHGGRGDVDTHVQDIFADADAGPAHPKRVGGPDMRHLQAQHARGVHGSPGEAGSS